jgi:hypothetical protein
VFLRPTTQCMWFAPSPSRLDRRASTVQSSGTVDREYSHLSRAPSNEHSQERETDDEFCLPVICPAVNKENQSAIALVYHPRILLAVTVRWVPQKNRLHTLTWREVVYLLSVTTLPKPDRSG